MESNKSTQHEHNFKQQRLKLKVEEALTGTHSGISSNTFSACTSAESKHGSISPIPPQININNKHHDDYEPEILCCGCDRPMMLIGVENSTLCYICKATPSTYVCAPCPSGLINFFDRGCAELPREIDYPYHHHALRLRYRRNSYCSACLRRSDGFNFGCEKCKFIADVNCALREGKSKPCT